MNSLFAINKQPGVISRRTLERLFRLQREHDGLVRAVRTRLARGAMIEECGLHFKLNAGRVLVSQARAGSPRQGRPVAQF